MANNTIPGYTCQQPGCPRDAKKPKDPNGGTPLTSTELSAYIHPLNYPRFGCSETELVGPIWNKCKIDRVCFKRQNDPLISKYLYEN